MALFGWLEMRKAEPKKANTLPTNPHGQLGISYRPYGKEVRGQHIELFQAIVWPDGSRLNPFETVRYQKEITEFSQKFADGKWFNICTIDKLMELCKVKLTARTKQFYKDLLCLHCVHYENMPPEVLNQLPTMMSAIFTEGESLKDIPNYTPYETPRETIKMIRMRDGVCEEFDAETSDDNNL